MRTLLALLVLALALAPAAHAGVDMRIDADNSPDGPEIDAKEITITASTTLCEKKPKLCHGPEQLLDGNTATAWCEGLPGDGLGATITLVFAHPQAVVGLGIVPHFAKSFALAEKNGQLAKLDLATDGQTFTAELDDLVADVRKHNGLHEDTDDCGDETCLSRDQRIQGGVHQYITFGHPPKNPVDFWVQEPVKTSKLVITLRGVYKGSKFHDTCASELTVYRAK